jgi:hypothetical protein
MILEKYATPRRIDTPISDILNRASTPIDVYKSVRSSFVPTPPPSPTFSPLLPTSGASGSGIHVKEEPPEGRKGGPRIFHKSSRRRPRGTRFSMMIRPSRLRSTTRGCFNYAASTPHSQSWP